MTDKDALLRECVKALEGGAAETQSYRADLRFRITAALAEKDDGKVWIGYAQEMPSGKLHFMETNCFRADIHDNGKPLYHIYRDACPLPPLPKGDKQ